MARPITLFTGQWADLPLEEVAKLASGWGYEGLELAWDAPSNNATPLNSFVATSSM